MDRKGRVGNLLPTRFAEPASAARAGFIALIVAGIAGLKLTTH
jgi:multidrug transporter EmrE-like cation transporter